MPGAILPGQLNVHGLLDAGFLFGLILLAAIAGGYAARVVRLPRVVGYLLAGVGLRFALLAVLAGSDDPEHARNMLSEAAEPLRAIKTLALGLIMFMIGNVFESQHVKLVGRRVFRISLVELFCVVGLVAAGCAVAWGVTGDGAIRESIAGGVLLGLVALATAPAATLLVLREYDSKGPLSDTILTLTAINNTLSIILFHSMFLIFASTGLIASVSIAGRHVWLDLLLTSAGSVGLGMALGFLFSVLYSKIILAEFLLVFVAALVGLGVGLEAMGTALGVSFNFLLTCLFLGAVFTNITLNSGPLYESLRLLGVPIFASFFVLAGYELHVEQLETLGIVGIAYVVLRTAGKSLGGWLGTRWAGHSLDLRNYIGLGLLCQAGVAIGLADFITNAWVVHGPRGLVPHPLAGQFKTVILGSVVLFEIVGPLVLKGVVKSAGEVKAITLIRRGRSTPAEGDSITQLTFNALLRTLGLSHPTRRRRMPEDLRARHIMRSNIKFLHASAKLDEVLHFVEGSRYNHFPVVDDEGSFVGMIHFSDLRTMIYDPHMRDLVTAIDLACPDDMVPADMPLDDLLDTFKATDVGSLVVVEPRSRRVLGLVEQRDLLRVLHGGSRSV